MTEKRRTPARLRAIKLDELSLVDKPANPHARVVMFKRDDDNKENDMDTGSIASFSDLDDAIEHLQNVHKCGRTEAMAQAARRYPSLVEKYNDAGVGVAKAPQKPRAVEDFDRRVDEVAKRDGVPRHEAMSRTARENPDAFAAYQEA